MTECNQSPQCIEYDPARDQPVNVQLSEELDRRNSSLIHAVEVRLESSSDVFQDLVNHSDRECGMVPLEVVRQHREERDVAVFELPRLREDLVERTKDHRVRPVGFSEELQDLVDRFFR